jgi:SAM-dependent methyltransferase
MNRLEYLARDIKYENRIIEIGPYHCPIAARKAGFQSTSLDIMDAASLREQARRDPNLSDEDVQNIEEVDLIGTASDVADLARQKFGSEIEFDWILSSHNIEHIPDPIRFLQQSEAILRCGGILRLAVPDKRACFDFFRPLTELAGWLAAFHERRTRPTIHQNFAQESLRCSFYARNDQLGAWTLGKPNAPDLVVQDQLLEYYEKWFGENGEIPTEYIDTHCWTFTPASFQLLIHDLNGLGLTHLQVRSCSETYGHEFFIDLEKVADKRRPDKRAFYARRRELLLLAATESGAVYAGKKQPERTGGMGGLPQKIIREFGRVVRRIGLQ